MTHLASLQIHEGRTVYEVFTSRKVHRQIITNHAATGSGQQSRSSKGKISANGCRNNTAILPTKGGLELIAIVEAEEEALAAILCAINAFGQIEEEAVRIMTPEEMDRVIERS